MYTLIIEDRHGSNTEISFDQGSYSIGRVDGNDVVLPSNSVSRTHARIFVSNNKCYIDDLGSANGVLVDGARISGRVEIKNGSKIRIGEYTLYLEYKDQKEMNAGQDVLKTQIVSGGQSGYKIVRVGDKFAGEEFMLTEASNSIGRTEDNYILLSEDSISRNHAKIVNSNLNYFLVDLDSSNGTFVNNKRIQGQVPLHQGDLIRFGSDVSFVFVQAAQHVDLAAYANVGNRRNDGRLVIGIFMGIVVTIVLIIVIIVVAVMSPNENNDAAATAEISQEDAMTKFQARLNEAKGLAGDNHFEAALNIVVSLQKENPDNREVNDLKAKIEKEISFDEELKKARRKYDDRAYEDALRILDDIDETGSRYKEAEKLMADCNSRIRISKLNDARSACDAGLSLACVDDYCKAALKLDPSVENEKNRIDDSIRFMDSISQKKSKYQSRAKKCSASLKSYLEEM